MIEIAETDSTNTELRRLLESDPKLPSWTTLRADFQTGGRGQRGNSWESNRGENISLSSWIVVDQEPSLFPPFDLVIVTSLTVASLVREYLPAADVTIKWPNDIYVYDRKIAGILIENEWEGNRLRGAIFGIGLNVYQKKFVNAPNPTSIALEVGDSSLLPDLPTLSLQLIDYLQAEYERLLSCPQDSRERYHEMLYRRDGKAHPFEERTVPPRSFRATILGVDLNGKLHLRDEESGAELSYAFKELGYYLQGRPEYKP